MPLAILISYVFYFFFYECPTTCLIVFVLAIKSRLQKDKKDLMLSCLDTLIEWTERAFICASHYVPKILRKLVIWRLLCIRIELLMTALYMFIIERQAQAKEYSLFSSLRMACFMLLLAIMTLTSYEKRFLAQALRLRPTQTESIHEPFKKKFYRWGVYKILFLLIIAFATHQILGFNNRINNFLEWHNRRQK